MKKLCIHYFCVHYISKIMFAEIKVLDYKILMYSYFRPTEISYCMYIISGYKNI